MKSTEPVISKTARFVTAILLVAFVFGSSEQSLADRYVDDDGTCDLATGACDGTDACYSSIQSAIDDASSEDVIVCPGTYSECITMKSGVNVVNSGGDKPTISCSVEDATVEFNSPSTPMTCNLDGFQITHPASEGAGILVDGSSYSVATTISNCDIYDISDGDGISLDGDINGTVQNNTIYDCTRAGIGMGGTPGSSGALLSGSSLTIEGNTIGALSPNHNQGAGIFVMGSKSVTVVIGSTGAPNLIHLNGESGIRLDAISDLTIDSNTISNNTKAGILLIDVGTSGTGNEAIVKNNTIQSNSKAGINIGGESYLVVGPNNIIYNNSTGGIAFNMGDVEISSGTYSSGQVTITGNHQISNNTFGGIGVVDPITNTVTITGNDIYSNSRGGIGIQNSCTLEIATNTIRDNIRGGIHTGTDVANDYFSDSVGFLGGPGSADLTITKNKVYHNGESSYGGGIDARHASGTITNNLVYENYRGGIRFGWENAADNHITDIEHNTVVNNGNHPTYDSDYGGGIIYDDLAGNVDDPPQGNPPGKLVIKNNICTHNEKAGIRACFDMTVGSEERDYNLVYANNGWDTNPDCGWASDPVGVLNSMSCANQQYGGCGSAFPAQSGPWPYLFYPHDIMDDPLFADMGADIYTLQTGSPAKDGGEAGVEMGAYGGSDPLDW
jgi:parallel beta-helix repeat protein